MTTSLHFPARLDAPIACDLTTASDTPAERLAAYRELFAGALIRRRRDERGVTFVFRAQARARVEELARREAACCPFVDSRVAIDGDELRWTLTSPAASAERDAMLDAFFALPEPAGLGADALPAGAAAFGVDVRADH